MRFSDAPKLILSQNAPQTHSALASCSGSVVGVQVPVGPTGSGSLEKKDASETSY